MRTWLVGMLIGLVLGLGATAVVVMLSGALDVQDGGHFIGALVDQARVSSDTASLSLLRR